jgi:hypothetical protein
MNKKRIEKRLLQATANLQGKEVTWQEMTRNAGSKKRVYRSGNATLLKCC